MKTALLIGDNTADRENIRERLGLQGYEAVFASDNKSGIAFAKEKKPDIILFDVMMPEMKRYEILNELKTDSETFAIPFMPLTTRVERRNRNRAAYGR